jgi:hypothetical protein
MYTVDAGDRVVGLPDIPQSSVGAPSPVIVASEHELFVAYLMQESPAGWDRTTVRVVGLDSAEEPAAMVRFVNFYATMLGPPNDEAFEGHPLAGRGLHPYGAFEIVHSSWVRQLERMNSVHPYHRPERFKSYRHFVLAFHDSTFECIAEGYTCEVTSGPLNEVAAKAARSLQ